MFALCCLCALVAATTGSLFAYDISRKAHACGAPGHRFSACAPTVAAVLACTCSLCAIGRLVFLSRRVSNVPTRVLLHSVWSVWRGAYGIASLMLLAVSIPCIAESPQLEPDEPGTDPRQGIAVACVWIVCVGLTTPSLRGWLQRALQGLVSRGRSNEAAALAALIGTFGSKQALSRGQATLRAIVASDLCEDDFLVNRPNPDLVGKVRKCRPGQVDCFLSHSWSDDGQEKWQALQMWCSAFQTVYQREPLIWFDKASIETDNLQEPSRHRLTASCHFLVPFASPHLLITSSSRRSNLHVCLFTSPSATISCASPVRRMLTESGAPSNSSPLQRWEATPRR